MVNEIPVIPVTEGVDWYQYNTKDLTGWVVKGNPFARPAAYVNPTGASCCSISSRSRGSARTGMGMRRGT